MKEISERQKKFCYEYMKDFNGTRAFLQAGYSIKQAHKQVPKVLKLPNVKKFLESLKSKDDELTKANIENIISECKIIAFGTIDGEIIKTADKLKALEMLGKYLGLFSERSREPIPAPIVRVFFEDKSEGRNSEF